MADLSHALAQAHAWVQTHAEAYAAQVAKETGVPLAVARYNVGYYLSSEYAPIDAELIAEQRRTLARYVAAGVIDAMPRMTDAGYLKSFGDAIRLAASGQ